jgi:hypothetical protein
MIVYRVQTTVYEEEDFFLLTDLTLEQVTEVMTPIVKAERDGGQDYDSEIIVNALQKRYPGRIAISYTEFDVITI